MPPHPDRPDRIPTLATERLTLRGHGIGDFDAMAALWADPEVTRHIGGRPLTREEAWGRLLRYAGLWSLLGYGYWAIVETASGRFVGEAGFADFRREIEPPLDGIPEAGWILASWAQGRGFGTEALHAMLAWGEAYFGPVRSACLIAPENLRSIRLARRCGYRVASPAAYKGQSLLLLRHEAGAQM